MERTPKKQNCFLPISRSVFWFLMGVLLGLFLLISFALIVFQRAYSNVVYPGIMIDGVNFGGMKQKKVKNYFAKKNNDISKTTFTFTYNENVATISAAQLHYGYNEDLLSIQAYAIGRSKDILVNISLIFQAYLNGINLSPSYYYSEKELDSFISPFAEKINFEPTNALFTFDGGKVTAFRLSSDGQEIDKLILKNEISAKMPQVMMSKKPINMSIQIPVRILKPKISTDKINDLGIKESLGKGTSLFQGSIQSRIYNITLASSRLHGLLVAPSEIFSFDKALGDISAFTGYKQAYVIENGRTVLGDGGGVCQVSTTFFRALLNAGLPILERHAHAYRVGYYEQDSPPGIDATIYTPAIDLKFKNDTENHILIQSHIDPIEPRLTFELYGTKDGRIVDISQPVISSQSPPPETLYQDDPTLLKGVLKQVDYAAWGANVSFTRQVTKAGKKIIDEKFISNYRPWQAVFLRGTKE